MRYFRIILTFALILSLSAIPAFAAKRAKFGTDKRSIELRKVKRSIQTSKDQLKWKMVMPWSKGLLQYDFAVHFAESVWMASGGRLKIKAFSAGELVGALETFDAVSKGSVEVGHDWPGYWKGKNEAFVAFGSVPFGLDAEGYNIWLYERGGLELMQELYGRYNLFVLPCGNGGQEMGLFSNKKATKLQDFKGMRLRTVGWFMDIMNNMGASVSPLPGGEVYLALERGVIDSAEFATPAVNYPMGFDDITKYVIQPGVHQPALQCSIFFNKDSYNELADDLKYIIDISARETQLWVNSWQESLNIEAINKFKEKIEIVMMDQETLNAFAKTTKEYLDEVKARHPDVAKVLNSQEQFKIDFATWREARGSVAPWPLEQYMHGKHKQ